MDVVVWEAIKVTCCAWLCYMWVLPEGNNDSSDPVCFAGLGVGRFLLTLPIIIDFSFAVLGVVGMLLDSLVGMRRRSRGH